MSLFAEYHKFVADHDTDCRARGISPRQATILAMAMLGARQQDNHGKVYFILLLPDKSTLDANDSDLLELMAREKAYLKWGDSAGCSFLITEEGVSFIMSNPEIFHELIPEVV